MKGKIDRLQIISHAGKRRLNSMRFRYLSKSIFANCKGDNESFEYVNFRGAHFSRSSFDKAKFMGCDFWGTTFKKCKFRSTIFQDCVFQGCIFKDCDFTESQLKYSAIVNTNIKECNRLDMEKTTVILNQYPKIECSEKLMDVLLTLKNNEELRKTKVFWISDKKPNLLNIYLLLRKNTEAQIIEYLKHLTNQEKKLLTTYGSISFGLNKFKKSSILQ